MSTGYHVAVVGATGAVGTKMIEMLEKTTLPIQKNNVVGIQTFCWEDPCVQK